jgi:hypothetical protein
VATLRDVLSEPDQLPTDATVYAVRPWTASTDVVVSEADTPPDGHEYLLEVDVVLDVLRVWSAWRDGVLPTPEEAAEAVIHYAERDAYLPVS